MRRFGWSGLAAALFCLAAVSPAGFAQKVDPVQWTLTVEPGPVAAGGEVVAKLTAKIEPGYHLYSATTQGANPTTVVLEENPAVAGVRLFQAMPHRKFDPNFKVDTETFDDQAVFLLAVKVKPGTAVGPLPLTAKVRYQACTSTMCLLPKKKTASATVAIAAGGSTAAAVIPAGFDEAKKETATSAKAPEQGRPASQNPDDLFGYLLIAAGFGLASIFTPCVFPMIPVMTSIFLNQSQEKKGSVFGQAAVFCLGLIIFFTIIGSLVTAIAGPFGVQQLTSNPWVNGVIAAVFVALGLSMMGAFEIALPSWLLTKLNNASSGGGYVSVLVMGLTFALTAFACVGPFIGTLLVASVQGGALRPTLGMVAYAAGLAAPFLLLGIFPQYLNKLPRSGGWLARVKMVMGFVILAVALKYLSVVDTVLHANVLTRERYLAIWFVLFLLPGLYLLGKLRLEGVKPDEPLGWGRLLVATAFMAFALSLLPGMFGGKLGELEAWIPFANENSIQAGGGTSTVAAGARPSWLKNDLKSAIEKAKAENKNVFVSFTGYACTNCHWMKANMLPRPMIASKLDQYVVVELYTDGTDAASEENQKLQEGTFQSVAIPFYAILTPDQKVVATSQGLTREESEYVAFLDKGLGGGR